MRKVLILLVVFLGLGAYVYFYEIAGWEERQKAEQLQESLLRLEEDQIESIEISLQGRDPVLLVKDREEWQLRRPLEAPASESEVRTLLQRLTEARRNRSFEAEQDLSAYGLDEPRLRVTISTPDGARELAIGNSDFAETNVYVRLSDEEEVFLTSQLLASALDKDALSWRSRKILRFEQDELATLEIQRQEETITLTRKNGDWFLERPLQEKADRSTVSALLSSLSGADVRDFVDESPEDLTPYGLTTPRITVRMRAQGSDAWNSLELGSESDGAVYARNPQRNPVVTLPNSVFESAAKPLWEFRNKDVVDIPQDEVSRLTLKHPDAEIVLRREDFQWLIEKPEELKDRNVPSYRIWFPLSDIRFESLETVDYFPEPEITVTLQTTEGTFRTFEFSRREEQFFARQVESGRWGLISEDPFEKLMIRAEEAAEE
ncbi:MAG TPA: DUF4340 domain-containing protein [Acidobacteriota bacterium]|nr:DUF4340 domain-containing protein [Acidobacteriota bacterium]